MYEVRAVDAITGGQMIDQTAKHILRMAIRTAIKQQNARVLFSCKDCQFYSGQCELDSNNRLMLSRLQPYSLPKCFTINYVNSPFAGVLKLLYDMGIDMNNGDTGWVTLVKRVIARADKYGYLIRLRPGNLERYG